jgi:hypothetical protein
LDGKWAASMHGRLHTTTAAIAYLRGAHAAPAAIQTTNLTTTPELFGVKYAPNVCCSKAFSSSGGGPEDRESGCQALHKNSLGAWLLPRAPSHLPINQAIASKLGLK